jgi:hypothetical protein
VAEQDARLGKAERARGDDMAAIEDLDHRRARQPHGDAGRIGGERQRRQDQVFDRIAEGLDRLRRRIGHHQFETRLDALLGKQYPGRFEIGLRDGCCCVMAPDAGGHHALGARAEAAGSGRNHIVIGEGERKGLAHLDLVERRALDVIEAEQRFEGRVDHHVEVRVGLQCLEVFVG